MCPDTGDMSSDTRIWWTPCLLAPRSHTTISNRCISDECQRSFWRHHILFKKKKNTIVRLRLLWFQRVYFCKFDSTFCERWDSCNRWRAIDPDPPNSQAHSDSPFELRASPRQEPDGSQLHRRQICNRPRVPCCPLSTRLRCRLAPMSISYQWLLHCRTWMCSRSRFRWHDMQAIHTSDCLNTFHEAQNRKYSFFSLQEIVLKKNCIHDKMKRYSHRSFCIDYRRSTLGLDNQKQSCSTQCPSKREYWVDIFRNQWHHLDGN